MRQTVRKSILSVLTVLVLLLGTLALAACGPKQVTLTFDTNGGSEIAPITAVAGSEITPPANPTKDGFIFDGWYLTASADGEKVTIPTVMPDKNTTYYAKYNEVPKATLTLDAAQGTIDTTTYQIAIGANVAAVLNGKTPTAEGLTFGGWFMDNGRQLSDTQVMPAAGLKLTARYKVAYTVEVLLQNAGDDEYTKSEELSLEGSDWVGATVSRSTVNLSAPAGYRFNSALSPELVLTEKANENVYRAHYDRASFNVFYLGNEPQGTSATGSMERETVRSGATVTVKESGYSLEGYRFAGWATSSTGDIVYQPGDSVVVENNLQLFACWNFGIGDANGGADKIYLLAEQPGKVLLERSGLGDKLGDFNAQTRIFTFEVNASTQLLGRIAADGLSFGYLDSAVAMSYREYDWHNETVGSAVMTLEIDGTATYTNGSTIEGTYEAYGNGYHFIPNGEGEMFYFVLDEIDGENVYLIGDGSEGAYRFMNSEGRINYPILTLDGFGNAIYIESSTSGVVNYRYVAEDGIVRVLRNGEVEFVCMLRTVETTTGDMADVFVRPDDYMDATFTAKTENGTVSITLDGFGNAVFVDESGAKIETIYAVEAGYVYGESSFVYILYLVEEEDGSSVHAFRYDTNGVEETVLDENFRAYGEQNATSGITARIRISGDTATIEFLMRNNTYRSIIKGTCIADEETTGRYTFTATEIEEDYRADVEEIYGSFNFTLFRSNNQIVFVIEDDYVGEYHFTSNGSNFTLVCNGYGTAQLTIDRNEPTSVRYSGLEGYTDGEYNWVFIQFAVGNSTEYIRVDLNGIGETMRLNLTGKQNNVFTDLNNRIPDYTEQMRMYPDGTAIISVTVDGTLVPVVVGTYEFAAGSEEFYVFRANGTPDSAYACYQNFVFTCVVQGQRTYYFCLYNEDEELEIEQGGTTLSLNGYGIAMYAGAQYLYAYDENGDLILSAVSGSREVHIRFNDDKTAFTASGAELGTFYPYIDGQLSLEGYIITLDGFGVATLSQYVEGDEEAGTASEIVFVAEGTYTVGENDYTISFPDVEGGSFSFIIGRISILGIQFPVYVKEAPEAVANYTIIGGGSISIDKYNNATYTNAEGEEADVTVRALEDPIDLSETPRMLLAVYSADGQTLQAVYQIENGSLRALDNLYGRYRQLIGAGISGTSFLLLDGMGGAKVIGEEGAVLAAGTYAPSETVENNYEFISATEGYRSFTFALASVTSTEGTSYTVFLIYEAQYDMTAVSENWEVLTLDGYGTATYIDAKGVVQSTYYTVSTDEDGNMIVGLFDFGTMDYVYYTVDPATGTFTA